MHGPTKDKRQILKKKVCEFCWFHVVNYTFYIFTALNFCYSKWKFSIVS
jgi:hypothetical protein